MHFALGKRAFLGSWAVPEDSTSFQNGAAIAWCWSVMPRTRPPIAMRTFLKPERTFGWMHGFRIDWKQVVAPS